MNPFGQRALKQGIISLRDLLYGPNEGELNRVGFQAFLKRRNKLQVLGIARQIPGHGAVLGRAFLHYQLPFAFFVE